MSAFLIKKNPKEKVEKKELAGFYNAVVKASPLCGFGVRQSLINKSGGKYGDGGDLYSPILLTDMLEGMGTLYGQHLTQNLFDFLAAINQMTLR